MQFPGSQMNEFSSKEKECSTVSNAAEKKKREEN